MPIIHFSSLFFSWNIVFTILKSMNSFLLLLDNYVSYTYIIVHSTK